jgi:hypothetical protein
MTMAATWTLLRKAVGPEVRSSKSDVRTLQQLLSAAGYNTGGDSGTWNTKTTEALFAFRDVNSPGPYRIEVSPDSDELLMLARLAGIEIPLPGATGMNGIQRMHDWFVSKETKYNSGAESGLGNRAIYGIIGHTGSAIQRINQAWRTGPVEMDCTTYVNLMLGIFFVGNAHQAPYDANCADYGALSKVHCGRDRYGFKEISFGTESRPYVRTADEMSTVARDDTLYVLEVAKSNGFVVHMALLYNGDVMECTVKQPHSACIKRPIAEFMRGKSARIYMYEQST